MAARVDAAPARRGVIAAVAAALLFTGCMPHVLHGPRVEDDGLSGSLSLTLGRNREIGDMESRILPSVYGGLRRSWVPADGTGVAGSIGIQVPLLLFPVVADDGPNGFDALAATSYVDLYMQPSRSLDPGFETGFGALGSTALAGPYLQAGRLSSTGQGWYTTQLVAFAIGDEMGRGILYLPSVVWRHRDPGAGTAANFSAGLGFGFGEDSERDNLIVLGVSFELGLGRN